MTKTWGTMLGLLLAAVALAVVFVPYFVGMQIEQRFRARVAEQNNAGVSVRVLRYERGFWHSEASVAIRDRRARIVLDNRILHGPFATFGWARIETRPRAPRFYSALEPYFDDTPFAAITRVGFTNRVTTDLASPPATKPIPLSGGGRLRWHGLHGQLEIFDDHASLNLNLPSLETSTPGRQVDVERLTVHADSGAGQNPVKASDPAAWNSHLVARVKKFTLADRARDSQLAFQGAYEQHINGAPDNTLNIEQSVEIPTALFDSLSGGGRAPTRVHDSKLVMHLNGLRIRPLQAALRRLRDLEAGGDPQHPSEADIFTRARRLWARYLPKILAGKPRLTLDVPQIALSQGRMRAHLEAALAPAAPRAASPGALRSRLRARAHMAMSRPLVMALLKRRMSTSRALLTLQTWMNRGLIKKQQAGLAADLRFHGQRLTVNGHPAGQLLSGLAPPTSH